MNESELFEAMKNILYSHNYTNTSSSQFCEWLHSAYNIDNYKANSEDYNYMYAGDDYRKYKINMLMLTHFDKLVKYKKIQKLYGNAFLAEVATHLIKLNNNNNPKFLNILKNIKMPYNVIKKYLTYQHFDLCSRYQNYTFKECINVFQRYDKDKICGLFDNIMKKNRVINKCLSFMPTDITFMIIDYVFSCANN